MPEQSTNIVTFEKRWVELKYKSEQAGHPVGEYRDYITIRSPGMDKQVPSRPVRPDDIVQYAREWDLYQRGLEQVQEGTPLEQWPQMSQGEVLKYKSYNVHTIEAMAALTDAACYQIGHGAIEMRKRAKYYLEHDVPRSQNANALARADEMEAELKELKEQNVELRKMVAELVEGGDEAPQAKPGKKHGKRQASQAQLDALAKGRARLAEKREAEAA